MVKKATQSQALAIKIILYIYRTLFFILWPFIYAYLLFRKNKGKEDNIRFLERLGYPSKPKTKDFLIWVHGASVGESIAVIPLINALLSKFNDISILLTTGTVTSANIIATKLPDGAFHQYVPVDDINAVNRFLKYWKPNLVLWSESDLWPNILNEANKFCHLILVNSRMSDKSFNRWQYLAFIAKALLDNFSLILPQSKKDLEYFSLLGAKNIKYIGNLKYDTDKLKVDSKKLSSIEEMIEGRSVFVAASTHKGEEDIIVSAHTKLKEKFPNLLTIIAPRHTVRAEEIITSVKKYNVNIAQRTKGDSINRETDIYLADTMDELGIFYSVADIVFIGHSFVTPGGGHNPLEPARFKKPIISGKNITNFTEVYKELEEASSASIISSENELIKVVEELLLNVAKRDEMGEAAYKVASSKNTIVEQVIKEIELYIKN